MKKRIFKTIFSLLFAIILIYGVFLCYKQDNLGINVFSLGCIYFIAEQKNKTRRATMAISGILFILVYAVLWKN